MKFNYLIYLFAFIMVMGLATASIENLGTFKQNSCISLLQTCADCSYNNVSSVSYPDGSQALGERVMTKIGTEFNYTFCSTTKPGVYNVNGFGDSGGTKTIWAYTLEVTPSGGAESNTAFFIMLIIISVSLLLLGFVFHNHIFSFFSGLAFLITGVYGMIYGYGDVTNLYTQMISYVLLGLGGLIAILSGLDLLGSVEGKDNYEEDED